MGYWPYASSSDLGSDTILQVATTVHLGCHGSVNTKMVASLEFWLETCFIHVGSIIISETDRPSSYCMGDKRRAFERTLQVERSRV